MSVETCFICAGSVRAGRTREYLRCANCGHEVLAFTQDQRYMLNDPPTLDDTQRVTGLDRFKRQVLAEVSLGKCGILVDVGSATGRFLFQNADLYQEGWGIEVTPEALEFSRSALGLRVVTSASELPPSVSIASAWHSLEHIPREALEATLAALAMRMPSGSRFIVSVPNAESRQYQWYGARYAYFDVPNHLHQFTHRSLDFLLSRYGFHRISNIPSAQYNIFGHTQSFLNLLTFSHNYVYYRVKRRAGRRSIWLDIANAVFLPVALPTGWALTVLDSLKPQYQGVITACFEKRI